MTSSSTSKSIAKSAPTSTRSTCRPCIIWASSGGWPLTMFLTPEGQPFWGGTYFPPRAAVRKAGLRRRIENHRAHLPRRAPIAIDHNRTELMKRARRAAAPKRPPDQPASQQLDQSGCSALGAAGSIPSTAACGARRNSRKPPCSTFSGGPGRAPATTQFCGKPSILTLEHICAGRHLRPSRRRLRALFGRRALARAAFRKNALRQRPADRSS